MSFVIYIIYNRKSVVVCGVVVVEKFIVAHHHHHVNVLACSNKGAKRGESFFCFYIVQIG